MQQKSVILPEIGEIILIKRKNSKNLRLTITSNGEVRVSMPTWVPYPAGAAFARKRSSWILKHKANEYPTLIRSGSRIGKSHRVVFMPSASRRITTRVANNEIYIYTNLPIDSPTLINKVQKAAETALVKESKKLLVERTKKLSSRYSYSFKDIKIKKLKSRWGSCSAEGSISLSCYLVQLPWELIDYVILHELVHTKHHNHSNNFWSELGQASPRVSELRREIKKFRPTVIPSA